MDRREFIAELRREMSGGFSTAEIEDAVSYYEDYIDMQIKKGKREDEILRQLGSPRLIAKSMKAAGRGTGGTMSGRAGSAGRYASGGSTFFYGEPSRDEDADSDGRMHTFRIPLWLVLLIVLFVVIAVLSFVFRLLIAVLPILLVVIGIIAIYRYFQRR